MWWKRRNTFPHHLPLSEGPYAPGCVDVMTDYSLEGCFVRFYYPTSLTNIKNHTNRWISWIPHEKYVYGFAAVLGIWALLLKLLFFIFGGIVHIPVVWSEDLQNKQKKFPVILFSHGLGATRFFYSTLCAELASHGFVVAAVEHRNSSASLSFYFKSPEDRKNGKPTWVPYRRVRFGGPDHFPVREQQIRSRALECLRAVDLLEKLNAGSPVENVLGGDFQLAQFKDRLDLSNLTVMGHSFGGATALFAIAKDSRFKVGVVLDGWMFPLKEEYELPDKIHCPVLFVNTQTFPIPSNISIMKKFMDTSPMSVEREVYTIRKTTHEHQTDTPYVVGSWLNMFMKKLDPEVATRINNHLVLKFLEKHVGVPSGKTEDSFLQSQAYNVVQALSI